MAARHIECILYVKNCKNGDDVNSEIITDMFILCSNYIYIYIYIYVCVYVHSFSSLSYDRSKASSKASSPHSEIYSILFQLKVYSPVLKVIQ